ncbi:uncharacterized protein LOC117894875 [Drosophila subobscura]|uniref:uncharacterized protein LOC117894875 n=1 Tax=Drosophila subobscura TaxID=7241 RepID=UPI00155B1EC4|nr:uncharacterized protein LOC117894875 [Drosophila subobscura]
MNPNNLQHTQAHSNNDDCNQHEECLSCQPPNPQTTSKDTQTSSSLAHGSSLQNARNELQLLQIQNLEIRFKEFRQRRECHVAKVAAFKEQLDTDWRLVCELLKEYNDGCEME